MKKEKDGLFIQAGIIIGVCIIIGILLISADSVKAGTYDGENLALAILANESWLIDSSYSDTDEALTRQSGVFSSLGIMSPTDGSTFALFSTGEAGANPVTSGDMNPGDERGTWYTGGKYGYPRDSVEFTMTLQVPAYMHYLYYDVQFFSTEYPEWVGSKYNDKFRVTVDSPSQGISSYVFDINSGYFVLESDGIPGTGFDVYALSGYPGGIDWVSTSYRDPGADAGASDLIPIGGETHPVSPHEEIEVTITIEDVGDNLLDSAAFIDNFMFTGYARTDIVARKTAYDVNGGAVEPGDVIRYTVTISNTGGADQHDNPGYEFEDMIPNNSSYVAGSVSATSGSVSYDVGDNKIYWDGSVYSESSVSINFEIVVNNSLTNGSLIRNQGTVFWDSDEDFINDATELTDDPHIDDGVDTDGDNQTDDDDPTDLYVISFDAPAEVTEGFSDDTAGGEASQSYLGREWLRTTTEGGESNFEVVEGYYDTTPKSFKTKVRLEGSPQYWYYNIPNLESVLSSWEISFKCGNATEDSDLLMDFYNSDDELIAQLKFDYVHEGTNAPVDWVLELYYWSPSSSSWVQLFTDTQGYLFNSWYTLKIEVVDQHNLKYSLSKNGVGLVDTKQDLSMSDLITSYIPDSTDSSLDYIKWSNSVNPIVCPMFFWDDHTLGLINT